MRKNVKEQRDSNVKRASEKFNKKFIEKICREITHYK